MSMNGQLELFEDVAAPLATEGVKYAGSKLKILPYIQELVRPLSVRSVLDAFAGTTRVSQAFAQMGYDTTANDIAPWSEVFATCYLLADKPDSHYKPMLDHLNALEGKRGWFAEHYGSDDPVGKRPFRLKNAMKLDVVRDEIDRMGLSRVDKCVVLTSLMLALDAVDNTLGHYAAYLAGWSLRSGLDLRLKLPRRFPVHTRNQVLAEDAFKAVEIWHDLVYFDPPYGSNNEKMPPSRVRYSAYYHLWKTIVLNDRPKLFGKANRREDSRDTVAPCVFEEYRKNGEGKFIAMRALDDLVEKTQARYILISYGSGGRTTKGELFDIISAHGRLLDAREIDYRKNVMSGMRWTNAWVTADNECKEYLFLMEK